MPKAEYREARVLSYEAAGPLAVGQQNLAIGAGHAGRHDPDRLGRARAYGT